MSYDPHTSASHWQHRHTKAAHPNAPRTIGIEVDKVRLARLVILLALVGFWTLVFMAIF